MVNFMSYLQGAHTWLSFQAGMQCGPSHHIPWCLCSRLSFLPWSRTRGIDPSAPLGSRVKGSSVLGQLLPFWPVFKGKRRPAPCTQHPASKGGLGPWFSCWLCPGHTRHRPEKPQSGEARPVGLGWPGESQLCALLWA